jgi:hypothetical protein
MTKKNWKLSPSDFAFLWEECKRCFYLKVVSGFSRPRMPMPKIFTKIDSEMKKCFSGVRLEKLVSGFPPGAVEYGERWIESTPIQLSGNLSSCYLRGRFDTVVRFDDGTFGVVDFKTSERKSEHMPLYSRQLHAYTYALENPSPGKFSVGPVSKMGLLVYDPENLMADKKDSASLYGRMSWIEVLRNDKGFFEFLKEVVSVLEQPDPPGGSASCEWCQYRDTSRRTGL